MKKKKKYITLKEYKILKEIISGVTKNQKKIIKSIRTITAFRSSLLEDVDGDSELVKKKEDGTSYHVTKKKKRRKHGQKINVEEIKLFFHGRGFKVKDDGEKPIKMFKNGKKIYVLQRKDKSIWKKDKSAPKGYKRVYLEDLV